MSDEDQKPARKPLGLKRSVDAGEVKQTFSHDRHLVCLLYTSPSPRDRQKARMPSSA